MESVPKLVLFPSIVGFEGARKKNVERESEKSKSCFCMSTVEDLMSDEGCRLECFDSRETFSDIYT